MSDPPPSKTAHTHCVWVPSDFVGQEKDVCECADPDCPYEALRERLLELAAEYGKVPKDWIRTGLVARRLRELVGGP